jgi:gliding motility-associated-like protein
MLKKFYLLFSILFMSVSSAWATHNRAGEITYRHISGFTYEITVTTYTKESSRPADRCALDVYFGDGTMETVSRVNGPFDQQRNCYMGVSLGDDIKMNKYTTQHTYPSVGQYEITMVDPNRNEGIENIDNSVLQQFALKSELFIYASGVPNSSPVLTNPPVDDACLREIYEHNPGAVDADISNSGTSDSLVYSLAVSLGDSAQPLPNFVFPDEINPGPNNNITVDPETGTIQWVVPQRSGEYNVAILIEEYREVNGKMRKVGSVLRDIQITVLDCLNDPPVITNTDDTCVIAGSVLNRTVFASDPNTGHEVTITATGDPFLVQGNKASFSPPAPSPSTSGSFRWNTQCQHIRKKDYDVVFRAVDDNPFNPTHISLANYETWSISVIGPPPTNEQAEPMGNGIQLGWDYNSCNNAVGYKIYRNVDSLGYTPSSCETGVPASLGYQEIADIDDPSITNYFDDDNGNGLKNGIRYCYLVYTYFEDGSESIVSNEFCSQLKREVPIITRVSVNNTDNQNGSDTVMWSTPTELDTTQYTGPYSYKVFRSTLINDFSEIYTTTTENSLSDLDTIFVDSNLNTRDNQHTYKIDIYSNGQRVGSSSIASSIFLEGNGQDNKVILSFDERIPWINNQYVFYRYNKNSGLYDTLDTTSVPTYTDTGLANGSEYCYRVLTIGEYSIDNILSPLKNFSQQACIIPEDNQPPCPPGDAMIDSDCELFTNIVEWESPNNLCDTVDDVVSYNVYFKPFRNEGDFQILENVPGPENTSVRFDNLESVAGCYAITAIDSFGNESPMTDSVCVDNCPEYRLPNVFTPGGDGSNDYLVPFPYRYVERVDMEIFNRWGEKVFETNNPNIRWDGTNKMQGGDCPPGVYYYTCTVYEIRLSGIEPRLIKGHVTLLRQEQTYPTD